GREEKDRPPFPGSSADREPLEIVETRGGKNYRGRVVGYDAGTRSYILLVDQIRLSVSESEILTIRSQGESDPAAAEPSRKREAPEPLEARDSRPAKEPAA